MSRRLVGIAGTPEDRRVVLLDDAGDSLMTRIEVVVRPSQVLRDTDRRVWVVKQADGPAVQAVRLGVVPAGWVQTVPWEGPKLDGAVVLVRLDDGREALVDVE